MKKKRKIEINKNYKKISISIINIFNYILYLFCLKFKNFRDIQKFFYIIDILIAFMIFVILSLFLNIFAVTFETE